MRKIFMASAILLTLAACSSKEPEPEVVETAPVAAETPVALPPAEPFEPRWERPGATPDEAEQQLSRCRYDVGMNAANLESSKVMDLIDDCMKKEGYRWVTE